MADLDKKQKELGNRVLEVFAEKGKTESALSDKMASFEKQISNA